MRKLKTLLLATLLAVVAIGTSASPVAAATYGDCSKGYIIFWSEDNHTGESRKFCWVNGGGDQNMDSPSLENNVGRLSDNTYKPDFFPTNGLESGMESITFWDSTSDSTNVNACLFYTSGAETVFNAMSFVYTMGNYNLPVGGPGFGLDDTAGRFRWQLGGTAANCTD